MRLEKMRMFETAEELMGEIDWIVPRVKSNAANAADHLERSGESLMFNMGEGIGAYSPKTKIASYEIAKREASEVRAILRRLVIKRLLTTKEIERAYNLAGAVIGMLTRAIIKVKERLDQKPKKKRSHHPDPLPPVDSG